MAGAELVGKEELAEISELFSHNSVNLYRYGKGNYKTTEFEEAFADYMGVKYAHAVSSGTAAIHCALAAAGVRSGDEVLTTAWTFVAPIEAIVALGATPVLVNIDDTFGLDPVELELKITDKTKAVVAVPMWAAPDMDAIIEICDRRNITLIEDAAQSLGAEYKGKKLGSFGALGTFSFDAGKSLHVGEGGMIVTDDRELYDLAAEFSDHGHMHVPDLPRGKDPRRSAGLNYRMSEITAAVGLAQLRKIDFILNKARQHKAMLKSQLRDISNITFRAFHDEPGSQGDTLIFSFCTSGEAIGLEAALNERGYGTKILPEAMDWHYGGVWTHIFQEISEEDLAETFSNTGSLLARSVCLNIPLLWTEEQIVEVAGIIRAYCASL